MISVMNSPAIAQITNGLELTGNEDLTIRARVPFQTPLYRNYKVYSRQVWCKKNYD